MPHVLQQLTPHVAVLEAFWVLPGHSALRDCQGPCFPALFLLKVFKLPWKYMKCHQLGPQARDLLVAFNFFELHLKLGHGDSLGLDLAVTRGCATVEHAVGCLEGCEIWQILADGCSDQCPKWHMILIPAVYDMNLLKLLGRRRGWCYEGGV